MKDKVTGRGREEWRVGGMEAGKERERESELERDHSVNGHSNQDWTRLKAKCWNSIRVFPVGSRIQAAVRQSFVAFLGALVESYTGSGATVPQTSIHMGFQCLRQLTCSTTVLAPKFVIL